MGEQQSGSIWTAWVIPLIIIGGVVAAFGFGIASMLEIPFSEAVVWAIPAVVIIFGYFFAEHLVYATVVRPMGYRCEMRPQPRPHSAQYDADLVISGNFRGRPFTLYRERHNYSSIGNTRSNRAPAPLIRSVVEWADLAFTAPPFELRIGASNAEMPDPFGIVSAIESGVKAVRAASGNPVTERPGEPANFPQSSRDQLTALMGHGVIEGSPGYLVIRESARSAVWTSREGKFPYPWEIEAYLDRADRIRHVFVS